MTLHIQRLNSDPQRSGHSIGIMERLAAHPTLGHHARPMWVGLGALVWSHHQLGFLQMGLNICLISRGMKDYGLCRLGKALGPRV